MRQFYNFCKNQKWSPLATKLTWSHYIELLSIKDNNKINYYINQCNTLNLSRNELRQKIKTKEYERLSEETKEKLKNNEKLEIGNTIKDEIIIYDNKKLNNNDISEKALKNIILEDIDNFLKELGEGILKEYSKRLTKELNKNYSVTNLKYMRQFYLLYEKGAPLAHQLSWSHYQELLLLKDNDKINYYINETIKNNWSKRKLREKIKNKEYERLPEETKEKLKNNEKLEIGNTIKNEIILYSNKELNSNDISEKVFQNIILDNMVDFLKELGNGYSFIENEYKIKIGNNYNYIDLLLFNIKFNCYVVVELKATELKKEHIGQIEVYMNYVNENVKDINHDKTIGIIIAKENNKFIIKYASDSRIYSSKYILV